MKAMDLETILKAVSDEMGLVPQEILTGGRKKEYADARKILSHIFYSTNIGYGALVYASNRANSTWAAARYAMEIHLATNDALAQTYHKIAKNLGLDAKSCNIKRQKRKKGVKAAPFKKWSVLDDIKIERAIKNSIAFMENYGRAK